MLEQFKGELAKRRLGEASSSGLPTSLSVGGSDQLYAQQPWEQQQQQQQHAPRHKRARVDSGSDLTTGALRGYLLLFWCATQVLLSQTTVRLHVQSVHLQILLAWYRHDEGSSYLPPAYKTAAPLAGLPSFFIPTFGCAGGSLAVSTTTMEGDRNVLKLKFARSRKDDDGGQPCAQQQGGQLTEYQRFRPRRQVAESMLSLRHRC